MGFMSVENSLTMVIGLRMEFLSRSEAVRSYVVGRLKAGHDPFTIASSITLPAGAIRQGSPPLAIDIRTNDRQTFADKLEVLEPGLKREYLDAEAAILYNANKDTGGNRDAILGWWLRLPALADDIRKALTEALTIGKPIRVRWESTIKSTDANAAGVVFQVENGVPTVVFLTTAVKGTDGGPVQDEDLVR